MSMETKDQRFFVEDGQEKATIDVVFTEEMEDAPSLVECRHAVLTIQAMENNNGHRHPCDAYVVYDRLLNRIVNGVFRREMDAVGVAHSYNLHPNSPQDMAPNGLALNLTYPTANDEGRVS